MLCENSGIVEFFNDRIEVVESVNDLTVGVRRNYGTKGTITVDFDMSMTRPYYSRIEYKRGTLKFVDGEDLKLLSMRVFKR